LARKFRENAACNVEFLGVNLKMIFSLRFRQKLFGLGYKIQKIVGLAKQRLFLVFGI